MAAKFKPMDVPVRPRSRLYQLLGQTDMSAVRLLLAVASIVWAILLLWPGDLFAPDRQAYALMSRIAPEETWGVLFGVQGTLALVVWWMDLRHRLLVFLDGFVGSLLWTVAIFSGMLSQYSATQPYSPPDAMSAGLTLMLASWWNLIRYKNDDVR